MDNKPFQADMDNVKLILQECSKDLQAISKGNDDIIAALNVLTEKISQYAEKQQQPKAVTVQTDTKPIEAIVPLMEPQFYFAYTQRNLSVCHR